MRARAPSIPRCAFVFGAVAFCSSISAVMGVSGRRGGGAVEAAPPPARGARRVGGRCIRRIMLGSGPSSSSSSFSSFPSLSSSSSALASPASFDGRCVSPSTFAVGM